MLELCWFGWVITSCVGKDSLTLMLLASCLGSVFTKGALIDGHVVLGKSTAL